MDNLDQTVAKLKAAADAAEEAAKAAQSYAEQLAAAGHAVSGGAIDPFVFRLAIFALAVFVGYYVVWSVTPALHTPLMSVTNAISSVIVVGALLSVGVGGVESGSGFARVVGFFALILASVNIFGGFTVTERMLAMYKKKGTAKCAPGQSVRHDRHGDRHPDDARAEPAGEFLLLAAGRARLRHRRRHRRLARAHRADDGDAAARRDVPFAGRP